MGLFDILGGGNRRGGGMSPIALAVLGTLAYKALKGKGGLAGILGSGQGARNTAGTANTAEPTSTAGTTGNVSPSDPGAGGLGGLLGGLSGGGLGAGLKDLLDRFRQTGHEEQAKSWVSTGANHPIAAHELEEILGTERIEWLMEQTGLPKEQLLAGLSRELPSTIDKLTPNGQVPTDDELSDKLRH